VADDYHAMATGPAAMSIEYWQEKAARLGRELDRVAAIVRDFAALPTYSDDYGPFIECPCDAGGSEHKPECAWRRAVEWVRDQETK
jgi:hypothetical protein